MWCSHLWSHGFRKEDLIVRAGEWDTQTDKELFPTQDVRVNRTIFHEQFVRKVLHNDIALLILESPVDLAENVGLVCLPEASEDMNDRNCLASGWGKDSYGTSINTGCQLSKETVQ